MTDRVQTTTANFHRAVYRTDSDASVHLTSMDDHDKENITEFICTQW